MEWNPPSISICLVSHVCVVVPSDDVYLFLLDLHCPLQTWFHKNITHAFPWITAWITAWNTVWDERDVYKWRGDITWCLRIIWPELTCFFSEFLSKESNRLLWVNKSFLHVMFMIPIPILLLLMLHCHHSLPRIFKQNSRPEVGGKDCLFLQKQTLVLLRISWNESSHFLHIIAFKEDQTDKEGIKYGGGSRGGTDSGLRLLNIMWYDVWWLELLSFSCSKPMKQRVRVRVLSAFSTLYFRFCLYLFANMNLWLSSWCQSAI